VDFERAYQEFLHGDLARCRSDASRGYGKFRTSNLEQARRFRVLEAKALLEQGLFEDASKLLESEPLPSDQPESTVSTLTLVALAKIRMHETPQAEQALHDALKICDASEVASCGDLFQAFGILASERSQSPAAERFYGRSLSFARSHGDPFLESTSLLNLGFESLAQGRLDETIDRSEAAYQIAKNIGARVIELVTEGNMGWAYYRLGDSEKALDLSLEAEKKADKLGDVFEQENELTNIGYIYMDSRKFDMAAQSFQRALSLAEGIKAKQDTYNALRVLARLYLETGDLANASQYADQALAIARQSENHVDELFPVLVQGQVAARRGDAAAAESVFHQIERDQSCPTFLRWEAEHSLARLYEDEKKTESADREYRAALATFEAARYTVRHEDYRFSFRANASRIYDDYIHFLVARGRADDALRWADYSRARTLTEGLGLLAKGASQEPPILNPRQIARSAEGTVLFYWLGEKQSYLWTITPEKTSLFTLPPGSEIDAGVQRYRKALVGPQNVLETANSDGTALYRMLISPAQSLLTKDAQIYIIPDGSLNSLNFETLLVPEPKLHYWIEDATIADANSLRLLAASHGSSHHSKTATGKLLLIGDAVAPNPEYGELPEAGEEIENIEKHFASGGREVLTRAQATPSAYLGSAPEQFSYIHFVAHGTASRLSPLDSAVILSKASTQEDSFKLYARDIIHHPLHAELVTISTCYGAGSRAYSGEGLVGLSWAFLRAGAHNVVGALWEVSDTSTPRLMDQLYDGLRQGRSPEAALRSAKLSLLHSDGVFRKPFYWAPFQLYTGT
jgi:CHAT domain-containing protein